MGLYYLDTRIQHVPECLRYYLPMIRPTLPRHKGDVIEIPIGRDKFYFHRIPWWKESVIRQLPTEVAQMDATLSAALRKVGEYELPPAEAKMVVEHIPTSIRERVFKIYLSVTGPERIFMTTPVYKAPTLSEAPIEVEQEMTEEEKELDKLHDALEEHIETQRKILKNSPALPEHVDTSLDEDDDEEISWED